MAIKAPVPYYRQLRFRLFIYLFAALIFAMPARTALEHHFLYFPETTHAATPRIVSLDFEEVAFTTSDNTHLTGWLIPGQKNAPVVLFCMGNAGNISHRLETLQMLNQLGVASFIFNYRGYGSSEGKASEKGTYQDVAGAVNFLINRGWPPERMIYFGRSLGAAISLQAALQTPPAGLIMEAPFTSVAAMGKHHYPGLYRLLGWLIGADYNNLGKIAELKSPLLLIHGQRDSVCPPAMAQQLYDRAPADKQLFWVPEADHNNAFLVGGERYRQTLRQVIKAWTSKES